MTKMAWVILMALVTHTSFGKETAPVSGNVTDVLQIVPEPYREAVAAALERAGERGRENLETVLTAVTEEQREGAAFLVATMPTHDLQSLSPDFLLENIRLSYRAWREAPWGAEVPKEHFLQYILPYASLNERRDAWRPVFFERYAARAWEKKTAIEATQFLNDHLFDELNVHYHATRRPKPDMSPFESMEAGYASCSGLSILLVAVCRAAGIPARIVGVPLWIDRSGNHNWAEVFDGRWYNVGSSGSDPRSPDWVNDKCVDNCDPRIPAHRVYAAATRPTGMAFPLVWNLSINYVHALNITRFYTQPTTVEIEIPGEGHALVTVVWNGDIVARARGEEKVGVQLAREENYQVIIQAGDEEPVVRTLDLRTPEAGDEPDTESE